MAMYVRQRAACATSVAPKDDKKAQVRPLVYVFHSFLLY